MKKTLLLFALLPFILRVTAQNYVQKIELNNIRAHVASAGLLFTNFAISEPGFEVPKRLNNSTPPLTAIYGSALWLGAVDAGNTQYVAGQSYRQAGNDFKVGPADVFTNQTAPYDMLWRITKADVDSAKKGIETQNVKNWPASYFSDLGQSVLAPFYDKNGDKKMQVTNGEYPIFPGDEALFFVYNDDTLHTETEGLVSNIEVKGFVYQYTATDNEFLNNTVFVDYYLTNKSTRTYKEVYAGIWTDFDLGDFSDDRVGTDTARNMYYCYNGSDFDSKYGNNPPSVGVVMLNQPLYSSISRNSAFGANFPRIDSQYFYQMQGLFNDGTVMTDKGDGYGLGTGGMPTRYSFSGNTCTNTGWTEQNGGVPTGDRRMLGSVRFTNVIPGQQQKFTVAYVWAKANNGGAKSSVCKLFSQTDSLQQWYAGQPVLSTPQIQKPTLNIYPNPASQKVQVQIDGTYDTITIDVYDITGKKIISTPHTTIDVSGMAKGLYIIRAKVNNSYFSKKLQVE